MACSWMNSKIWYLANIFATLFQTAIFFEIQVGQQVFLSNYFWVILRNPSKFRKNWFVIEITCNRRNSLRTSNHLKHAQRRTHVTEIIRWGSIHVFPAIPLIFGTIGAAGNNISNSFEQQKSTERDFFLNFSHKSKIRAR